MYWKRKKKRPGNYLVRQMLSEFVICLLAKYEGAKSGLVYENQFLIFCLTLRVEIIHVYWCNTHIIVIFIHKSQNRFPAVQIIISRIFYWLWLGFCRVAASDDIFFPNFQQLFTNMKLAGLTVNYAIFSCHRSGVVFSVRPFSTCSVYRSGHGKVLVDRLCKLKVTYQN